MGFVYDDTGFVVIKYKSYGASHIDVPDGVQAIARYTFEDLDIRTVYIPDSVKTIAPHAFHYCEYLTEISVSAETEFAKDAVFECPNVKIVKRVSKKVAEPKKAVGFSEDAGAEQSKTDYKSLFLEYVYAKETPEKEAVLDRIFDEDVKIPVAVYFYNEYRSKKAQDYISANSKKVMHWLVEKGDTESLSAILKIIN